MNLKTIMSEQKINAKQLAEQIGISQRRLEGWMYGEREPPIRYLIAISDALGCSVDRLVREEDQKDGRTQKKTARAATPHGQADDCQRDI